MIVALILYILGMALMVAFVVLDANNDLWSINPARAVVVNPGLAGGAGVGAVRCCVGQQVTP
jgi:hypothetical protein